MTRELVVGDVLKRTVECDEITISRPSYSAKNFGVGFEGWDVVTLKGNPMSPDREYDRFHIIGFCFGDNPHPGEYYDFNPGITIGWNPRFSIHIKQTNMYYTLSRTRIGSFMRIYEKTIKY